MNISAIHEATYSKVAREMGVGQQLIGGDAALLGLAMSHALKQQGTVFDQGHEYALHSAAVGAMREKLPEGKAESFVGSYLSDVKTAINEALAEESRHAAKARPATGRVPVR